MRFLLSAAVLFSVLAVTSAPAMAATAPLDSDHDGLSDALENALLAQFAPRFMVSNDDCSAWPAQFVSFRAKPIVYDENGTIYGQAFPRAGHAHQIELHYYHLWRSDCGEMGHHLDAEHVSVLLNRDQTSKWKALYWYAAAHEYTVCDASQIARASTVDGELHGPQVWISHGKHASFLSDAICSHGCGGDNCRDLEPLSTENLINLGELSAPMNGAIWAHSPQWPLAQKMGRSDFTQARIARVDGLPATTIAWANPDKRPIQAAILGGNDALGGTATGLHAADTALDLAQSKTGNALDNSSRNTGNSLGKALRSVKNALRATTRKVGKTMGDH